MFEALSAVRTNLIGDRPPDAPRRGSAGPLGARDCKQFVRLRPARSAMGGSTKFSDPVCSGRNSGSHHPMVHL